MLGAFIIALGALVGIWLGAYYAAGRLSIQLDQQARWFDERREEEAERLERQLEAESKRLAQQLEHDRRMRDRDALMMTLDEGAILINEAVDVLHWLATHTETGVPTGEEQTEVEATRGKLIDDLYDQTSNGFSKFWQRLLVRFPAGHPIPTAISKTKERVGAARDLYEIPLEEVTEERKEEYRDAIKQVAESHTEYLVECRKLIGVD